MPLFDGIPAQGDYWLCPTCACWSNADHQLGGLRWLPITDPRFLTDKFTCNLTDAGLDDPAAVPWFDPSHELWWRWNYRFLLLPEDERAAIIAAADDRDDVPYEIRSATVRGVNVAYTCGREPSNLVLVDPVGSAPTLFQQLDRSEPNPVAQVIDGHGAMWVLAPIDPAYEALACRDSLVVITQDVAGRWPWEDPDRVILTHWRPNQ